MSNQILGWLSIGDLRSDGQANEAAAVVLAQPLLFPDLLAGLSDEKDIVRAHAADALEKVSRQMPELLVDQLDLLIRVVRCDDLPMVRWHIAMIFGNLAHNETLAETVIPILLDMLADESAFVKSWCISSLVIWGRNHPDWQLTILEALAPLSQSPSIAVRHRTQKAIHLLLNPKAPMPAGWLKSTQSLTNP
jgi:HEAT repeat protein